MSGGCWTIRVGRRTTLSIYHPSPILCEVFHRENYEASIPIPIGDPPFYVLFKLVAAPHIYNDLIPRSVSLDI
jgi:hypothetical protein